ncbi:DinB family protein [Nocardioides sp.]|uniref:DinB family protein n=1 Tax=Nocardioides sp. TaxID=35761 RepID=UPI002612F575|nr:DinB family protein [Nocardioides sp.]
MAIVPDDKDWTWVLERQCSECGFDPAAVRFAEVPGVTRRHVALWVHLLESRTGLGARPDEATWSPLEYAAHLRDVCRIMLARLDLMLVLDNPDFANWDQDETALAADYGSQDPAVVAVELAASGEAIARAIELVPASALERTGQRSNGSRFTVATLVPYFLHDLVHHGRDVGLV